MSDQPKCDHPEFVAHVAVGRLSDDDGGPIAGYSAAVKVECAKCGLKFRFIGLAAGNHYAEPRVSVDGLELRAPIEPAEHMKFQASASYTFPNGRKQ